MKEQIFKTTTIDTRKARLYFPDGHVDEYYDQNLAFKMWLALPEGTRGAFSRGK